MSLQFLSRDRSAVLGLLLGGLSVLLAGRESGRAEDPAGIEFREVGLPPLRDGARPMRAHTQGLVWASGRWWVTARREDVSPRSALLLAWRPGTDTWDHWELSAKPGFPGDPVLDHAGGFQMEGNRLWIPLAESRRRGRSVVAAYDVNGLTRGPRAVPAIEFPVPDHVGAIAVMRSASFGSSTGSTILLGASWDTESVYGWSTDGNREFLWNGGALQSRGLGPGPRGSTEGGVAVQDWKWQDGRLYASGLSLDHSGTNAPPYGRLLIFSDIGNPKAVVDARVVPRWQGMELAREAMFPDADGRGIWFLPADLALANRLVRVELGALPRLSPAKP